MEKNIIECIDRSLDQSNEGHETSERKEIRKYISAFHIIISIIIFSIDFIFFFNQFLEHFQSQESLGQRYGHLGKRI